jgi:YHS domain-containing protein
LRIISFDPFPFSLYLARRALYRPTNLDVKRFLYFVVAVYAAALALVAGKDAFGSDAAAQDLSEKDAKSEAAAKVNVDSQGVILKGYDAVAYLNQGKAVKGNPEIESAFQGARYLFASSANKADFDKDPAKYAPQYGAFCSYGVTVGVLVDPEDPEAFAVYKGKLYVCGNQGALKSFKSDIDLNIEKADTNWRQLSEP